MFKIKTWYYPKLLTTETMKLLGKTKSKITKDKNGENVDILEITEVTLAYCNIVDNDYQKIQEFCIHLFLINHFCLLLDISSEVLYF